MIAALIVGGYVLLLVVAMVFVFVAAARYDRSIDASRERWFEEVDRFANATPDADPAYVTRLADALGVLEGERGPRRW